MSVSVSRSLAYVEQGRSTCNVSRSLSVEFFCFAACVCHVCLGCLRTSNKDDRSAMSVAISPSSFFASQRVSVTAPNRRELCRSLADSLAKSSKNHRENRSEIDPWRHLGTPKIDSEACDLPPESSKERVSTEFAIRDKTWR